MIDRDVFLYADSLGRLEWANLKRSGLINPLFNWLIVDDMAAENGLNFVRRYVGVPNALGPNHEDWPAFAHPQAVDFAS